MMEPTTGSMVRVIEMVSGVMVFRQWFRPVWPTKPAKKASVRKPTSHVGPVHPTRPWSAMAPCSATPEPAANSTDARPVTAAA